MEIRIIETKDVELFKAIRLEALKDYPESFASCYEEEKVYSLDKFIERLQETNTYIFGAFDNKKLLGIVGLHEETRKKVKHKATINSMYVNPTIQKSGIGKKLMITAINKAKELKNIEQLHLSVTSTNVPAKNLYASLGFKTYGTEKRALKINNTYYDEDYMILFL